MAIDLDAGYIYIDSATDKSEACLVSTSLQVDMWPRYYGRAIEPALRKCRVPNEIAGNSVGVRGVMPYCYYFI